MINVLFICTHNRCRSILGEAIMRQNSNNNFRIKSAGSAPVGEVHPETIKNLIRHGYQTQGLMSQSWNDLGSFIPDITITVCDNAAKESCPLWLGKSIKIHWGLPDPTHENISDNERPIVFDKVINTIESRIKELQLFDFSNRSKTETELIFNQIGELF